MKFYIKSLWWISVVSLFAACVAIPVLWISPLRTHMPDVSGVLAVYALFCGLVGFFFDAVCYRIARRHRNSVQLDENAGIPFA